MLLFPKQMLGLFTDNIDTVGVGLRVMVVVAVLPAKQPSTLVPVMV